MVCRSFIFLACFSALFCTVHASSSENTNSENLNTENSSSSNSDGTHSTALLSEPLASNSKNSDVSRSNSQNSDVSSTKSSNTDFLNLKPETSSTVPQGEEKKYKNQKQSQKSETLVKTGFHSAFGLGIKRTTLHGTFIDSTLASKKEEIKLKHNHLGVNLSIGYDKNVGVLVFGADVATNFNFGSAVDYKKDIDITVANIKTGAEYLGLAKLGIALGRVMLYGKLGGGLAHIKYDWKIDDAPKDKSNYIGQLVYGGGVEFRFTNDIFVNTEFVTNNKKLNSILDVSNKKGKVENSSVQSYQISMGCGYRF